MLEWTGNLVYFAPDCVHSLHPVFAWKVPGAKIPGSESSRVLKFQGAKVPGSEWSWERKVQFPYQPTVVVLFYSQLM